MADYPPDRRFMPAIFRPPMYAHATRQRSRDLAELPARWLQKATEFYAQACSMPAYRWSTASRFSSSPIRSGRDVLPSAHSLRGRRCESQVGATITHRTLAALPEPGLKVERRITEHRRNTDFPHMLIATAGKQESSKTEAVQSQLDVPLKTRTFTSAPRLRAVSLRTTRSAFSGRRTGFGGVPIEMELRLSVEDSPNSAGSCCRCGNVLQTAETGDGWADRSGWRGR